MRVSIPIAAALLLPAPALAGEIYGGVYVHDVTTPVTRSGQEGGIDLQLGWRGDRIAALRGVGAPSPHVFASLSTAGDTNYAGAGVSWKIGRTFYVRPGIGMALHDGPRGASTPPDRIDFGTGVLFVPEIAAGYQFDPRLSIEASWVHYSHAQIFSRHNPGSDNFGVRLNYRFR